MTVLELAIFGLVLFAALTALLQWKYRRARNAARVNRGLRDYLAWESDEQSAASFPDVLHGGYAHSNMPKPRPAR